MSLIPESELITLKPAADVRTVADSAEIEHENMAIAHAINTAANTGQYSVTWQNSISEQAQKTLKNNGYTLTLCDRNAYPQRPWTISWRK